MAAAVAAAVPAVEVLAAVVPAAAAGVLNPKAGVEELLEAIVPAAEAETAVCVAKLKAAGNAEDAAAVAAAAVAGAGVLNPDAPEEAARKLNVAGAEAADGAEAPAVVALETEAEAAAAEATGVPNEARDPNEKPALEAGAVTLPGAEAAAGAVPDDVNPLVIDAANDTAGVVLAADAPKSAGADAVTGAPQKEREKEERTNVNIIP